ncbi:diguanylate cyclase [Mesorhizobium hawassense]|uniref:Diguanylate cyclase n=1 Tax=Mesorhizobium hawassense TaxID=1209954 RepID=A0A330HET1_9HYPH|nr:EAL domain-containing protein [Mesorhizobium hawassense]RAZ87003.1 diguanylate cyclase [Mesorhizobium hawassense]
MGTPSDPTSKEPTAQRDHGDLSIILAAAPLGLTIVAADGNTVFCSPAKNSDSFRTRRFDIDVNGRAYALSISLDESEWESREDELIRSAYFDDLTGLPNRSLLERSLSGLIADANGTFALAFIDVDGFKSINDYYGHGVGDRLLVKIAERLSAGLRRSDMLARLSGDEFVLLVSPVHDRLELERDLVWMSERLKEPFFIDGYEILVSASFGVSLFPDHGRAYDVLRDNADRAMYDGKTICKGTVRFFDESIQRVVDKRSRLEQRIRLAIRDKRVCCAYQPKVNLRSGETMGVEVLMRWRDEEGAIQPPGDFLGLAVELGLIDELTHLILAETVASIDRLNEMFGPTSTISINVAAKQAGDRQFMRSFVDAIEETGFASRFIVEITEETLLSRNEFQECILPMIRAIGAKISIDDFGVGFSSLSVLADITADEVKIDRSFITKLHRRPRNQSILKAIEALGHSLGMTIVVEGVESFEEVAFLQATTRVELAQGYYFAKPIVLDEVVSAGAEVEQFRISETARSSQPSRQFSGRLQQGLVSNERRY